MSGKIKSNMIEFDYWALSKLDSVLYKVAMEDLHKARYTESDIKKLLSMTAKEMKDDSLHFTEARTLLLSKIIRESFYKLDDELKKELGLNK